MTTCKRPGCGNPCPPSNTKPRAFCSLKCKKRFHKRGREKTPLPREKTPLAMSFSKRGVPEAPSPSRGAAAMPAREPEASQGTTLPIPSAEVRIVGSLKLDGTTKLRLNCAALGALRAQGSGAELEGLFDISSAPHRLSFIHREAQIDVFANLVVVGLKKEGLRELGERRCTEKWINIASLLVGCGECRTIDAAEVLGWTPIAAELALDVVGFPVPKDAHNFSCVTADRAADLRLAPSGAPTWICPTGNPRPRDDIGLTIQDKSQWARSKKSGVPKKLRGDLLDHPVEGPDLFAHGLKRGELVTRLEVHPAGRALVGCDAETGEELYNLTTLSKLLDPDERRRFWSWYLRRVRYLDPDGATHAMWSTLRSLVLTAETASPARVEYAQRAAKQKSAALDVARAKARVDRARTDHDEARRRLEGERARYALARSAR